MAPSTSLSPISLGPTRLVAGKFFTTVSSNVMVITPRRRRRSFTISASESNKDSYDGKMVDGSMIVLRLRIHEIQMKNVKKIKEEEEMSGGRWRFMEWERKYWQHNYASDICQAVGLLQNVLMETRPCLPLAVLFLVFFSISVSMSLTMLHLAGLGKNIFNMLH